MGAGIALPEDVRELAEHLAERVSMRPPGRLVLIFDENGRYTDGYAEHTSRLKPSQLSTIAAFPMCECLTNTTMVQGLCIVCRRPKRPT